VAHNYKRGVLALRVRISVVSIVMVMFACCGAASAATFTLGQTDILHQPSVAVDANGNAYVAWNDATAPPDTIDIAVCEIPAGTTTCNKQDLSFPDAYNGGDNPHVYFDSAGGVNVVVSGENGGGAEELDYFSINHGATWTPSAAGSIGDLNWSSAAYDPSSGIVYGVSIDSGVNIATNAAEIGDTDTQPPGTNDATLVPPGQNGALNTSSAVSDTAAGVSVVHVWDGGTASSSNGVSWGYYKGPALKSASTSDVISDVGDAGNWQVGSLADRGTGISLAGGPSGIFLAEQPPAGSTDPYGLQLRAFEGGTTAFGAPAGIDCEDTSHSSSGIQGDSLSEDPTTGALQAIYIEGESGYEAVRYTEVASGKQSPPVTIGTNAANQRLNYPSVATNGAHPGLAIWLQTSATNEQLEATWLPSVSLTGCPSATPPGGGQTQSTTEGGQQITLTAPSATTCTASAGLSVQLSSKTIKSLAKGPKFANAQFFIDKGVKHTKKVKVKVKGKNGKTKTKTVKKTVYLPNKTAKRLPANETFSIKGLKAGTHKLTVKVHFTEKKTLTVGHGKHKRKIKTTITITRTLKATFKVC
jgi:hypothetical protein